MAENKSINIVLAGQGNAGKSVVFNYLTGLHQHIGNWAGKTIEKKEGTLYYKGYTIDILDLPGIYSLATYSEEEVISREYIVHQKPEFVINIVDAVNLERNLIFTLQLLELECPVILVLNMMDLAKKKGIVIDTDALEDLLNTPVVPTVALRGSGITCIIDKVIELKDKKRKYNPPEYGKEIEKSILVLSEKLKDSQFRYPPRWLAIKLLEKDRHILKLVEEYNSDIIAASAKQGSELEEIHGHDSSIVISDERSHLAAQITRSVVEISPRHKPSLNERLDYITTHKLYCHQ